MNGKSKSRQPSRMMDDNKTFDEKMRELDKRIERDMKSINATLLKMAFQALRNFRYTNNTTSA